MTPKLATKKPNNKKKPTTQLAEWKAGWSDKFASALLAKPEPISMSKALRRPGVIMIMGHLGSGKTGLACYLMDWVHEHKGLQGVYYLPPHLQQMKQAVQKLTPAWISVVSDIKKLPNNTVILVDEAAQTANARRSMSSQALDMDALCSLARQKGQHIIFVSHHSRKLDMALVMQTVAVLWKRPTYLHAMFDRDEMEVFTYRAIEFFEEIYGEIARKKATLMADFEDLKFYRFTNGLPSWWSDALSHVFENA